MGKPNWYPRRLNYPQGGVIERWMRNCVRDGVAINPDVKRELPDGARIPTVPAPRSHMSYQDGIMSSATSSYGDNPRTMAAQFVAQVATRQARPVASFQQTGIKQVTPSSPSLALETSAQSFDPVVQLPLRLYRDRELINSWWRHEQEAALIPEQRPLSPAELYASTRPAMQEPQQPPPPAINEVHPRSVHWQQPLVTDMAPPTSPKESDSSAALRPAAAAPAQPAQQPAVASAPLMTALRTRPVTRASAQNPTTALGKWSDIVAQQQPTTLAAIVADGTADRFLAHYNGMQATLPFLAQHRPEESIVITDLLGTRTHLPSRIFLDTGSNVDIMSKRYALGIGVHIRSSPGSSLKGVGGRKELLAGLTEPLLLTVCHRTKHAVTVRRH